MQKKLIDMRNLKFIFFVIFLISSSCTSGNNKSAVDKRTDNIADSSIQISDSSGSVNDRKPMSRTVGDEDLTKIKARLFDVFLTDSANTKVNYVQSIKIDGAWSDIVYSGNAAKEKWTAISHLDRVLQMAILYNTKDSQYYKNKDILSKINKGLKFWFSKNLVSRDWWYNVIGIQRPLVKILVLMENNIDADLLKRGLDKLSKLSDVSEHRQTGANLVWLVEQEIVHGVLTSNDTEVLEGSKALQNEIKLNTKEGIQYDYAFHQHGAIFYNAGYGLAFLKDLSFYALILKDTKFEFSSDKLKILSSFLIKGMEPITRGIIMDYNANGRAFTRRGASTNSSLSLIGISNNLSQLLPENKSEYNKIVNSIKGNFAQGYIGNKFFWSSDFMSHQREKYYFSVKMASERTIGAESLNGENVKGGWMPFGSNFIIKNGKEYQNIFPAWDWTKIPGVTSFDGDLPIKYQVVESDQKFVAGVSDGTYGAAAMSLNKNGLTGLKSWFFFDDEIVMLGANISLQAQKSVFTTLNQTLLSGGVSASVGKQILVLKNGPSNLKNVSWVYHNGVGYIFPNSTDVNIVRGSRSGSWNSINRKFQNVTVKKDIFTLYIPHGVAPVNKSYAYIIVPGISSGKNLITYHSRLPIRILKNDSNLQAVTNTNLNVSQFVFYKSGSIDINNGLSISVSKPCLVLLKNVEGGFNITVSNPFYTDDSIKVTLNSKNTSYNESFVFQNCQINGISITKKIRTK